MYKELSIGDTEIGSQESCASSSCTTETRKTTRKQTVERESWTWIVATVIEYLEEFERTILEANALKYPDSSKISNPRPGLNQSVKNILVSTKEPTNYREWCRDVIHFAQKDYTNKTGVTIRVTLSVWLFLLSFILSLFVYCLLLLFTFLVSRGSCLFLRLLV